MNNEAGQVPMSVDKASDLRRHRRGQGYEVLIGSGKSKGVDVVEGHPKQGTPPVD